MATNPQYASAAARADKMLEPDGSIQTHSGTVVSGPSAAGAAAYSSASARADKLLQPDGSITTSGSGTGGSTPPGGVSGDLQYNNAGVFAGVTSSNTDGTNLSLGGYTGALTSPLMVGSGANISVILTNPGGTMTNQAVSITGGSSSQVPTVSSPGSLGLYVATGGTVSVRYLGGGTPTATFNVSSATINGFTIAGAATGGNPYIQATGSDANIGINLFSKGTGVVVVQPGTALTNGNALQINKSTGVQIAAINTNEGASTATLNLGGATVQGGPAGITFNGVVGTTGGGQLNLVPQVGSANALTITNTAASVTGNYFQVTTNGQPAGDILKVDSSGNTTIRTLKTAVYTVATLPAATAALQGARALVTDATAPTFLGTLTGGGSVICPVFCNGSAWIAG